MFHHAPYQIIYVSENIMTDKAHSLACLRSEGATRKVDGLEKFCEATGYMVCTSSTNLTVLTGFEHYYFSSL